LSVEGILKSVKLVALSKQEVEESNNSSFEFSSLLGSDSDWWKLLQRMFSQMFVAMKSEIPLPRP
jgi:hypothetical protein